MNESLASYVNRICNENVCKINWLLEPIKVNMEKANKILNKISNDEVISKIIEATGLSKSEIKSMTCNKFITESSLNKIFPPLYCDDVKCCPLCLKEKYYHQIHWQLIYIKICLKHNLVLNNVCSCGKQIEINELIDGVCKCGMEFSKLKPMYNKDEHIYINQYRIYDALEIEQKLMKITIRESSFCGLGKEKFLCLYYLILTLMANIDNTKLLELSERYSLKLNKVNKINSLLIVEKILNNYPNDFYVLLDFLNDKEMPTYSHGKIPNLVKVCTPIFPLEWTIRDRLYEIFHEELHYYLITRYYQYNKKLISISKLPKENEYISTDIEERWYSFSCYSINSLFKTKVLQEGKYVKIDEVLSFVSSFIEKGTVFFEEDRESYVTLRHILEYFNALEFELDIIIRIILEEKIEIKICIYERGLDMVYIHKDSAIKTILQLINIYRKDKTYN
jgi:hypothetical protein